MKIKIGKWFVALMVVAMLMTLLPIMVGAEDIQGYTEPELALMDLGSEGVKHIGSDTITKGDWFFNPEGSPIGRYGSCAYILPNPPRNKVEEVVGNFHAPVGFDIDVSNTYNLLGQSPWDWTPSQILGLDNYRPDSPYFDEFWTADGMETFDYTLSGTYMKLDSRSLVDKDELFTRAACWFAGSGSSPSELDIELNIPAGEYMLSLYLIDWDNAGRKETVTVEIFTSEESESVDSFYDGVYVNFFVNLPDANTVKINVSKILGANAVVSGVFLSSTTETAADSSIIELRPLASDTDTQGNWVGTYGNIGWVLSAYDVPSTKVVYTWSANYDRSYNIDYSVSGTQYAWNDIAAFTEAIQYPVFEWAWDFAKENRPTDLRAAYYPIMQKWRPAVWDDGGERGKPEHGYFDFNLHFPEGRYMLSLYTYDWERTRSSQEYQLFNANDLETILASSVVSGTDFNEGVYESFVLEAGAGGRDMVVRVYNDQGYPTNINVLLQGVFVDCLRIPVLTCETAWGYNELTSSPNNEVEGNPSAAWGWTNLIDLDNYENPVVLDLYAGAGQNDLNNGTLVGKATIEYDEVNEELTITYELEDKDCWFSELHLWVGETQLPLRPAGRLKTLTPTSAPGQFNYTGMDDHPFVVDVSGLSKVWIAAHAVVCCYEY
jgi:hypothetical protein